MKVNGSKLKYLNNFAEEMFAGIHGSQRNNSGIHHESLVPFQPPRDSTDNIGPLFILNHLNMHGSFVQTFTAPTG